MTDDLEWFAAPPEPVRAALLADPGVTLPPPLCARLPRPYRATYGTTAPANGALSTNYDLRNLAPMARS